MKVKIITNSNISTLETSINSFISSLTGKEVVDIKVTPSGKDIVAIVMYK